MRQKKEEMLKSEHLICPRIKKRLDLLVTESRKWSASWDGDKKFAVKQGTRVVIVDLEAMTCSCRVFELTGIPCEHAIAAIYDRRHQVVDYVSDFYKREKYLATYQHALEAINGEEFWEINSTDELLPPDIPKKLRGRPKKLRRKEDWEGGNRSQTSQARASGPVLQRFSNKRKMHCSLCKSADHRKSNCPTKGENQQGSDKAPAAVNNPPSQPTSKKRPKELKRQKMQIRRKTTKVPTEKEAENDGGNGEAVGDGPEKEAIADKGKNPILENVESDEGVALARAFKVPRKFMPFLNESDEVVEKQVNDHQPFQDKLLGPLGFKAVFMPTPGFVPFLPPRNTPPASTPPNQLPPNSGTQESSTLPPTNHLQGSKSKLIKSFT